MIRIQYNINVHILLVVVMISTAVCDIQTNCGSGATIGEPHNITCTYLPDPPKYGLHVFRSDVSVILCTRVNQVCASTNNTLYSVVSPHTDVLTFTILNVTEDDINKEYKCGDDSNPDNIPSTSGCKLQKAPAMTTTALPASTTKTTDIQADCGSGATIGEPYNITCTGLPDSPKYGIHVFRSDETIIICLQSVKKCFATKSSLYSVDSNHTDVLRFTILVVKKDDINKEYKCGDGSNPDSIPSTSGCKLQAEYISDDGLSDGEIAGIVIGVIAAIALIIGGIGFIVYKNKSNGS